MSLEPNTLFFVSVAVHRRSKEFEMHSKAFATSVNDRRNASSGFGPCHNETFLENLF